MSKLAKTLLLAALIALTAFLPTATRVSADSDYQATSAECMATVEVSTNRVLYSKNANKKRPMASVTKILTAITVLENTTDLSALKTVPKSAQGIEGSSIYLEAGEKISTMDLLYGLMLQSGNDCAVALAVLTSGSTENFANLMNETAQKAGATDSNFTNPHGLHHDDHYTTALDLAKITTYALKNPIFKQIAATKSQKITRTRTDAPTTIINKNRLLRSLEGADGVKTGFTKKAGRCFVASATQNGMQVVCVVLNCGPMFEDSASLLTKAFKDFQMTKVASANHEITQVPVKDGKINSVKVGVGEDLYYPLKSDETVKTSIKTPTMILAPLKCGSKVGEISFLLDNRLLFAADLFTIEDAPSLSYAQFLKRAVKEW